MAAPAFTDSESIAELFLDLTTRAAALDRDDPDLDPIEELAIAGFTRFTELLAAGKIT